MDIPGVYTALHFAEGWISLAYVLIAIVLFCIVFSYKTVAKKSKYNYFLAFAFLGGLAFVMKALAIVVLLSGEANTVNANILILQHHSLYVIPIVVAVLLTAYKFLLLLSLFSWYAMYAKQSKSDIVLFTSSALVIAWMSYYVHIMFHAIIAVLCILIAVKVMPGNTSKLKRILLLSLGALTGSQICFALQNIDNVFFIGGTLLQMLGYAVFIIFILGVKVRGKKKPT